MPVRLSARRAAPLTLLLLPLLAGCGPTHDQFPPVCPSAGLVAPTGNIALYRPGTTQHDLADQVVQGRIVAINGQCRQGDDKSKLDVDVTVSLNFLRGPAMQGNDVTVPVFVAVTEGDRILDKKIYDIAVKFPSNVDQTARTMPPLHMVLPVAPDKSGAAYRIVAGFQLSPAELQAGKPGQ